MVTDSNDISESKRLPEIIQVKDGYNVAFIYNTSSADVQTSLCQVIDVRYNETHYIS